MRELNRGRQVHRARRLPSSYSVSAAASPHASDSDNGNEKSGDGRDDAEEGEAEQPSPPVSRTEAIKNGRYRYSSVNSIVVTINMCAWVPPSRATGSHHVMISVGKTTTNARYSPVKPSSSVVHMRVIERKIGSRW